jgi:hypothetical protein
MSDVRINKSALKHGILEVDIRIALTNFIYEDPISGEENKFLAVYAKKLEKEVPSIRRGEGGPLTRERDQSVLGFLDSFSAQYIRAKANATSKSAPEVISDLVHNDIASA